LDFATVCLQAHNAALADGGKRGLAVVCALYLGLRRFEIARLRWDQFERTGWIKLAGKGNKVAVLPVHPELAKVIDRFRAQAEPSPWIFPGRFSGSVKPDTIAGWTKAIAAVAAIEGVSPHRLRHSCLATAQDLTHGLAGTQMLARHASPATTRRYTRSCANSS
jgi:integrase